MTPAIPPYLTMTFKFFKEKFFLEKKIRKSTPFPKICHPAAELLLEKVVTSLWTLTYGC